MDAHEVWEKLLNECKATPLTLQTKTGLHFNLSSNGERLLVAESQIEPSSKLKRSRQIYKENFLDVFPFYERLQAGEKRLNREIQYHTRNSVYILPAIKYCCN